MVYSSYEKVVHIKEISMFFAGFCSPNKLGALVFDSLIIIKEVKKKAKIDIQSCNKQTKRTKTPLRCTREANSSPRLCPRHSKAKTCGRNGPRRSVKLASKSC